MQVLLQKIVIERRETFDVSQVHFVTFPSDSLQDSTSISVCAASQLEMAVKWRGEHQVMKKKSY